MDKKKKIILLTLMMILCMVCMCACSNNESGVKESSENTSKIENTDINEQDNENSSNSGDVVNVVIDNSNNANNQSNDKKIAVVYFSATGTTKQVAEYIKDEVNAEIFEIVPKQIYSSADLNWNDNNSRSTKEQNDEKIRPEIQNSIDVSSYETIFIGYPIWWGDTPRIIQTFMESHNLNGKTMIPFCTSGGSGISGSEKTLKSYKGINWIVGKRLSTSRTDVSNWVKSLNIKSSVSSKENNNLNTNKIIIEVNNRELEVTLENNQATKELVQKLNSGNVTVKASEYGGFEKVGSLGFSLTKDDKQITTQAGDLVLYQGNQISLFYNSNSWSYTKLGKVTNLSANELKKVLGNGDVTLTLKK